MDHYNNYVCVEVFNKELGKAKIIATIEDLFEDLKLAQECRREEQELSEEEKDKDSFEEFF